MLLKTFRVTLYWVTLVHCVVTVKSRGRTNYCLANTTFAKNYVKKEIVTLDNYIYSLAVSHHTGYIYAVDWEAQLFKTNPDTTYYIKLEISNCQANAVAVDGRAPILFVACKNGLKTVDEATLAVRYSFDINLAFWQLYVPRYTSDLYAMRHDNHDAYLYPNLSTDEVKLGFKVMGDSRYQLAVDRNGNVFYTVEESGQHVTKIQFRGTSKSLTYNAGQFLNLAADSKGRVYGTRYGDLYRLNADGSDPELGFVFDSDPYHLTFDVDDNIIFGTGENQIIICKYDKVMTLPSYAWKFCEHGEVPAGAVSYGYSWDGEPLYIGRSYGELGQILIGQINPKLGVCFFPSAMTETTRYECLVVYTRPCTKGTPNAKTHLYEKRLSMLESKFNQMNKTRTEPSGGSPQASVFVESRVTTSD